MRYSRLDAATCRVCVGVFHSETAIREIRSYDCDQWWSEASGDHFENESRVPDAIEGLRDVEKNCAGGVYSGETVEDVLGHGGDLMKGRVVSSKPVLGVGKNF